MQMCHETLAAVALGSLGIGLQFPAAELKYAAVLTEKSKHGGCLGADLGGSQCRHGHS